MLDNREEQFSHHIPQETITEWKSQEKGAANDWRLDAVIDNLTQESPNKVVLAAMTPDGTHHELFAIATPDKKTLPVGIIDGEFAVGVSTRPMLAYDEEPFISLSEQERGKDGDLYGYRIDGQTKYLRRQNSINFVHASEETSLVPISKLEERILGLSKENSEKFSAEFLAAVYIAKLEQNRQIIESAVKQQGIPSVNMLRNEGDLLIEGDQIPNSEKKQAWTHRDPEDGDKRGTEWMWAEEKNGEEVIIFKGDESLSVIYLPDQQRYLFNIEAAPAQAYKMSILLNGGADEGKILKKLTAKKEAGEEHGLEITAIEEMGTIYPSPDKIKGASNMHFAIGRFISKDEDEQTARKSADEVTKIFPGSFSKEQVQWLILHKKIQDARTIAGFYMAEIFMQHHPSFISQTEVLTT